MINQLVDKLSNRCVATSNDTVFTIDIKLNKWSDF